MAIGEHGFLSKQVDLNSSVITKLDAMTTTDGIEPENLNSGLVPSDVVIGSSVVSNKTMKLWLPNGNLTVSNITAGVAIPVTSGGSGAATFTDGGILLGSGTGAFTALGAASNGQIPIGDGTTDPVLATITATAGETEIANGAGTITVGLPAAVTGVTTISNKYMKVWAANGTLTFTNLTTTTTSVAGNWTVGGTLITTGAVTIAEGKLTDSTVVSADIKDGDIAEADLKVVDSPSDEDVMTYESTTGDFEWHSANEYAAKITTGIVGTAISSGNIALAQLTNATTSVYQPLDADLTGLAGKTIKYLTLTNMVYNGGSTTGNVNIVSW
jgi:hypothetical protein